MDMTNEQEIAEWLAAKVAEYLDTDVDEIDPDRPLAECGLDSVYALALCGDIEDTFGIEVEPTLAWDHPSVAALSRHLAAIARELVVE